MQAVRAGAASDSGIANGGVLIEFADAVVNGTEDELNLARTALVDALGAAGMVDSAAVVASFNSIVRIASATGIPLEDFKQEQTATLRTELGMNAWRHS